MFAGAQRMMTATVGSPASRAAPSSSAAASAAPRRIVRVTTSAAATTTTTAAASSSCRGPERRQQSAMPVVVGGVVLPGCGGAASGARGVRGGAVRMAPGSAATPNARRLTLPPLRGFGGDGSPQEPSLLDQLDDRCPVPKDQRPSSQLREVQESLLLGWGGLELQGYLIRLGVLSGFFFFVIAYPVACDSYNPATQPVEAVVAASVGSLTATAVIALFIFNNWSYVRDRLLSATVEYEETGWYDGQVYVKDPEMLARDRLLGTYTVRPIVERLRKTLLGCGAGVFVSLGFLNGIAAPEYGVDTRERFESNGTLYYQESSRMEYEPPTAEELAAEAEEEAEAEARYDRAMRRFTNDKAEATAVAEAMIKGEWAPEN